MLPLKKRLPSAKLVDSPQSLLSLGPDLRHCGVSGKSAAVVEVSSAV